MGCLSELPDEILRLICSSLNNKDAIRLSISSKDMLRVISKRPTLIFYGDSRLFKGLASDVRLGFPTKEQRYREEVDYMLSTLERYQRENIDLETFRFQCDPRFRSSADDRCMELAVKKRLRNLCLSLEWDFGQRLSAIAAVPEPVFRLGSLVQLTLEMCSLRQERMWWHNLKRLCLHSVVFAGGEGTLEGIIRSSPLIEILEIFNCCFDNLHFCFKIGNLPNLKQLNAKLLDLQTVEVNAAPNLESMDVTLTCGFLEPKYQNLKAYSPVFQESEYQNLRSLRLEGDMKIDGKIFAHSTRKFPKLEELSIRMNRELQEIHVSSPSLKKIRLVDVSELREARVHVRTAALFQYKNYASGDLEVLRATPNFSSSRIYIWKRKEDKRGQGLQQPQT